MKILFCKSGFAGPVSGADETVVVYAAELRRAGHAVGVLLVHPPAPDDPHAARLAASRVPIACVAPAAFSTSLVTGRRLAHRLARLLPRVERLIRDPTRRLASNLVQRYHDECCAQLARLRPQLIHVVTPDPGAMTLIRAAHSLRIPVVYQELGVPFHPPGFEAVYERFTSVLPLCSSILALSPRLARTMQETFTELAPPSVLPLISQDTHLDALANSQRDSACGYAATKKRDAPVTFGFAARFEHLKGALRFIEAAAQARGEGEHIELRLAGDGSQRDQIIACLRRHNLADYARLVGIYTSTKQRSRFMRELDVFVLPSLTEGTPNSIIEAMAAGLPVIATDVGGVADLITDQTGILVPPADAHSLVAAMRRLAGNRFLRERMGQHARRRYEQLFSPAAVLPLMIELYEQVLLAHARTYGLAVERGDAPATSDNCSALHPWAACGITA